MLMGNKKIILVILIFITGLLSLQAEELTVFEKYPSSIGAFYGDVAGMGLSYQRWFSSLGFELAGGLWYTPIENAAYQEFAEFFVYNIGVQAMYTLVSNNITDWISGNLYLFAGVIHYGHLYQPCKTTGTKENEVPVYEPDYSKSPILSSDFGTGFGIGIETVLLKHFSLPIEFGIDGIWQSGIILPKKAGFFVQSGLRYRF